MMTTCARTENGFKITVNEDGEEIACVVMEEYLDALLPHTEFSEFLEQIVCFQDGYAWKEYDDCSL